MATATNAGLRDAPLAVKVIIGGTVVVNVGFVAWNAWEHQRRVAVKTALREAPISQLADVITPVLIETLIADARAKVRRASLASPRLALQHSYSITFLRSSRPVRCHSSTSIRLLAKIAEHQLTVTKQPLLLQQHKPCSLLRHPLPSASRCVIRHDVSQHLPASPLMPSLEDDEDRLHRGSC